MGLKGLMIYKNINYTYLLIKSYLSFISKHPNAIIDILQSYILFSGSNGRFYVNIFIKIHKYFPLLNGTETIFLVFACSKANINYILLLYVRSF